MKLLELNKQKINIFNKFNNIDFLKYKILCDIDLYIELTDSLNKYLKLSPGAIEFFKLGNEIVETISHVKHSDFTINDQSFSFRKYINFNYFANQIKSSDKTLLITNIFQMINRLGIFKKNFDVLLFKNEEYNINGI